MIRLPAPDAYALPEAEEAAAFPLRVLRILFFTGFAILATVLAFVFLPLAGVALAAFVAWTGLQGRVWTHRDFALRALSMLAFVAFAVVATVLAFVALPLAGLGLAALFLWRGFGAFGPAPLPAAPAPLTPTGNAAFDAYREETLQRLEAERVAFEGFVARLREARDKQEFDGFLDDRIARARGTP